MVEITHMQCLALAVAPFAVCVGLFVAVEFSLRAPAFAQFVKYGAVGVQATYVQMAVCYALAATCLPCLAPGDWAVETFGFAPSDVPDGVRAIRFGCATAVGFVVSNVFCWLMNRRFVFTPGRHRALVEFALFFGIATLATVLALAASMALIRWGGVMTSVAIAVEIAVSFFFNFFFRKFFVFRG